MGEYYNGAYIFDVEIGKKAKSKTSVKIDLTFKEENKISEERNGFRGIGYLADCLEKGRIELDKIDAIKLATVVKNLGYLYGSKDKRYTNNYVESIVRYVYENYKNCANPVKYFTNCYDEGMRARVEYNKKEERKSVSMVTQALNNEMMAQNALKKAEDRDASKKAKNRDAFEKAKNRVTSIEMNQAIKTEGLNPEEKNRDLTK